MLEVPTCEFALSKAQQGLRVVGQSGEAPPLAAVHFMVMEANGAGNPAP